MKYYIIAGEASGDLHGSNLIKAIHVEDPEARIHCWGGDLMANAGGNLIKHYRDLAFMGFVEVLKNIRTILANMRFCKEDILQFQPDALVLIDYPGFNLRIAKWAAQQNIPVYYYISPQLWAWHSSRIKVIRQSVRKMYVILPFEQAFYQKYQYPVTWVGHPLLDVTDAYQPDPHFRENNQLDQRPIIALLPGSRKQEIQRLLDVMLSTVPHFPEYQFVIAGAPAMPDAFYRDIMAALPDYSVRLLSNQTYALLAQASAALVTSGTATLETALFGVPQIVCYKGSNLSYQIAKRLVDIKYISLVNLIADAPIVTELIQHDCNPTRLLSEMTQLLQPDNTLQIKNAYAELRKILGQNGAAPRTAQAIVSDLKALAKK
ncbi:MAG: lipid-A-disaccharide synthase [Saprospiraceae bacterium]|nr:lipid-A-disaccharide synthase [Saprospiraceae bacterium]MDP4822197.1 lipid-A-disaccharide synthase [Saprospiraceae bacterium]MDP5000003.1 lipid-A-disaccharide synthase [Saprospiraceae bacterium]